ncbi:MAG: pyridoxamine 5'-phosphate oxidase family protein [Bifidobacteriaceae bacterium]|jgi:nitroimidazol reductase NimA-like FMN-containing flavoprotein (pyridoxamine 5'-phosphate oxidase superfamily)|nr:pyridoxamine 5'-phosphate oxidase family protein [Bifidobacteriaceae bacterium]
MNQTPQVNQTLRRADRAVSADGEIDAILGRCEVGRLGLWSRDEPYVLPLHFAHVRADGRLTLYFHGAGEGRKLEAIGEGARACFETDRRIGLVDSPKVCRIGATFESVIAWGRVEPCADPATALAGLVALVDKYAPGRSAELTAREAALVTVLRMVLDEVGAKRRE